MVDDWRRDRIGSAERGENPTVLARMRSGYAVIGDTQFLPGYCVLLAVPRVGSLEDLPLEARGEFLLDMSLLGEAIAAVCHPRRLNYAIFGNADPFLHAHAFPRYLWEPDEHANKPPFHYPPDRWTDPRYLLSEERHAVLKSQLRAVLLQRMGQAGRAV